MKGLQFKIDGDWAHFKKPETNNNPLSHDLIPKTALIGMIGAVLGIEREKMKSLFPHDNFKDNYKVLNQEVRKFGINVPPLVNAYMSLSPKMRVFGTAINHEFGEVEETGILIAINEILEDKKKRHIETYLEEEYKSAELIRKNFIGE